TRDQCDSPQTWPNRRKEHVARVQDLSSSARRIASGNTLRIDYRKRVTRHCRNIDIGEGIVPSLARVLLSALHNNLLKASARPSHGVDDFRHERIERSVQPTP